MRNYRLFPGEGVHPVSDLVDRVLATGYDGVISLEVFNARYRDSDAAHVAYRGMDSLERLLGGNVRAAPAG